MRLIVDVNVVPRVFLQDDDPDFKYVHTCLFDPHSSGAILVYGGHLAVEYARIQSILRVLAGLDRAGRALAFPDELVDTEEAQVRALGICRSNDTHIIALARVSKARLLCSLDKALAADFKNSQLINDPRGKVYKKASHQHLLPSS